MGARITNTTDGFRFERPYTGAIEWRVYDSETGDPLGMVKPNGSRIRERSWDYRASNGTAGRAYSRQAAAESLRRVR